MRQCGKMSLTMLEQHALLAVAALQPDAYSGTISDHIRRHAGYPPTRASVFVALHGLEWRGLVRSRQRKPTPVRGGRAKFYWSITPQGQRALTESLKAIGRLSSAAGLQEVLALEPTRLSSRPCPPRAASRHLG